MISRLILLLLLTVSLFGNGYLANELWNRGNQTTTQVSTLGVPTVMRTAGGLLEVSVVKATEDFQAQKNHMFWGVPLGNAVSKIRVPATYRYHIELAPEWKIYSRGGELIVITPPVKPSLPVAVNLGQLEVQKLGVWAFIAGNQLAQDLQSSITKELAQRALNSNYIQLQREEARKTVREFVHKWVLTQDKFKQLPLQAVKVYFPDEPIGSLKCGDQNCL